MRILFVNAYFEPEVIAFSHLEKDLLEQLTAEGHEVEVICPTPTRGVTEEVCRKYRSLKTEELYDGKVHVRRFSAPREGKNPIIRALRYFWCNLREYQIGRKYKDIDVVFAVSTPPTQGLLAGKLSKKLKCPFVYSLQDVFPDSLVTTGLTREGSLIWRLGRRIERKTYERASRIIVISKSCRENLLRKGVAEDKLDLISNWVDVEQTKPVLREDNPLIRELAIDPSKFLVVYAGNFGAAQGAEIVLKAAEALQQEEKIGFVIFGGGSEFEDAVSDAHARGLTNVTIQGLLPKERVSQVYSLGDVALITCKAGVGGSGMPSKTWSIMACNTPIIASFDPESDLADVIRDSGAGACVEPGQTEPLVAAIRKAYEAWCTGEKRNLNLRTYVEKHASGEQCVKQYIEVMQTGMTSYQSRNDKGK